jgi:UTP--glucose-1-phosphate uridylyltransferase
MKIRKAVLPVAGVGTRFLPVTKSVPKELLPIGNKPVIQLLVEEAVSAGITEIIFVISKQKELIRDYFSHDSDLEIFLRKRNKEHLLKSIQPPGHLVTFSYVYQNEPNGDGDAILKAESIVGKEPFLVLFGDELIKNDVTAAQQMVTHFKGEAIVAVQKVPHEAIPNYGIIETKDDSAALMRVTGMVEKPSLDNAPSDFGMIGKYICPPEIFQAIHFAKPNHDSELRLIDGLRKLCDTQSLWAVNVQGQRFDTGQPEGLLAANNEWYT